MCFILFHSFGAGHIGLVMEEEEGKESQSALKYGPTDSESAIGEKVNCWRFKPILLSVHCRFCFNRIRSWKLGEHFQGPVHQDSQADSCQMVRKRRTSILVCTVA